MSATRLLVDPFEAAPTLAFATFGQGRVPTPKNDAFPGWQLQA
jgi:hypothetical protein